MCDYNKLIQTHHRIDDARKALKREYEAADQEYLDQLEKIEGHMLVILNDSFGVEGSASVAGTAGTFYREEDVRPRADDWDTVYHWIAKNDAWEMLEKRLTKTFVKKFMEANKDENGASLLPQGVSVFRKFVVRVRRAK
jgi:hypothetical protein